MLAGTSDRIVKAFYMANVADDPQRFFDMDDQQLINAHRQARHLGASIIAIWHSHPGGPATPSQVDSDKAFDASLIWLISAPKAGDGWQTKCFQAPDHPGGKFKQLSLNLVK